MPIYKKDQVNKKKWDLSKEKTQQKSSESKEGRSENHQNPEEHKECENLEFSEERILCQNDHTTKSYMTPGFLVYSCCHSRILGQYLRFYFIQHSVNVNHSAIYIILNIFRYQLSQQDRKCTTRVPSFIRKALTRPDEKISFGMC